MIPNYLEKILSIRNSLEFDSLAMEAFNYQFENLSIYQSYCRHLAIDPSKITRPEQIPFLPIEFFKNHRLIAEGQNSQLIFTSSGTTGTITSRHYVASRDIYHSSLLKGFQSFYGNPSQYCFLALLPSYLERKESSLVYMVRRLMKLSGHPENGFYLENIEELSLKLKSLEEQGQKTILIGVSFALLDLAEKYSMPLKHTILIETGGMKGRRKEITRAELHGILKSAFGLQNIHSEYGMTELLSQAYSAGDGLYSAPPWMKILIRDIYDPFHYVEAGKTGGINLIDLANIYSCSFIETKDVGKLNPDNSFEVSGRFDFSDTRGCNLLVD
jgi:phenylacetate-coenzyme A ligase PaaK-like adenylate-forming protein